MGIAIASSLLERKRIMTYSHKLAANRVIPLTEVDVLKSVLKRRKLYLKALFSGDFTRWLALNRYHRKVTEAAFTFHRVKLGDTNAPRNLARLEKEYQTLRQSLT
jgi:hypothetical protein